MYLYLRNTNKGVFVIGFLDKEDYVYPEKYDINTATIKVVDFNIDLNEFEKVIKLCKSWYENFIEKGISPKIKDKDIKWLSEELDGFTL